MATTNPKLPKNLVSIREKLEQEFIRLRLRWNMYRQIFASGETRFNFVMDFAPTLMSEIHQMWVQEIVLSICRLTDPPRQGQYLNLSLWTLEERLNGRYKALKEELSDLKCQFTTVSNPVRLVRSRMIAHASESHYLDENGEFFEDVSRKKIEDCLDCMQDYLVAFNSHFSVGVGNHELVQCYDAEALVYALKRAAMFAKLSESDNMLEIRLDEAFRF